ncbi:transcription factor bHLH18-like protein [Tanacetum coccineum]
MEEPGHIMKQHQQTQPYYTDSVEAFSSRSLIDSPSLIKTNQSTQLTTDSRNVDNQHDYKVTKSSPLAPSYGSISNTFTISFGNPTLTREMNEYELYEGSKVKHTVAATTKEETSLTQFIRYMDGTGKVRNTKSNRRQAQEHVVAERKRREKLAERFISLSVLLPGLKKVPILYQHGKHIVDWITVNITDHSV